MGPPPPPRGAPRPATAGGGGPPPPTRASPGQVSPPGRRPPAPRAPPRAGAGAWSPPPGLPARRGASLGRLPGRDPGALPGGEGRGGIRDVAGIQPAGRDLVQQWLEGAVDVAVDQHDAHARANQLADRREAREARANDDDPGRVL